MNDMEEITSIAALIVGEAGARRTSVEFQHPGVCRQCGANALTGAKRASHRLRNRTTFCLEGNGFFVTPAGKKVMISEKVLDTLEAPSYVSPIPRPAEGRAHEASWRRRGGIGKDWLSASRRSRRPIRAGGSGRASPRARVDAALDPPPQGLEGLPASRSLARRDRHRHRRPVGGGLARPQPLKAQVRAQALKGSDRRRLLRLRAQGQEPKARAARGALRIRRYAGQALPSDRFARTTGRADTDTRPRAPLRGLAEAALFDSETGLPATAGIRAHPFRQGRRA